MNNKNINSYIAVIAICALFSIVPVAFGAALQNYNLGAAGATNYEVGEAVWNGNVFQLQTRAGGTGVARAIQMTVGSGAGIFINTSGNVGIGTTGPGHMLDVNGNILSRGASVLFADAGTTNREYIASYDGGITGLNTRGMFGFFADDSLGAAATAPTAGISVAGIYSSSVVGIGSTAPAYTLDVAGTGRFTQPVTVGTPTAAGHATTKSYVDSVVGGGSGTGSFATLTVSGASTLATGSGSVGIGTTSPSARLHVANGDVQIGQSGTAGVLRLSRSSDGNATGLVSINSSGYMEIKQTGGAASNIFMNANGIEFQTEDSTSPYNKVTRMVIRHGDSGNVGIGTTTPTVKLKVAGDIEANNMVRATGWITGTGSGQALEIGVSGGSSYILGYNRSTSSYAPVRIGASTITLAPGNDSVAMTLIASGNVGINSASPAYKLDVAGTGQFTQPVIVGTPTATNHATTKSYVDSAAGGGVGAGTSGQTLRHNGTAWGASSFLYNNGAAIGIGTTNPRAVLEVGANSGSSASIVAGNIIEVAGLREVAQSADITITGGSLIYGGPTSRNGRGYWDITSFPSTITLNTRGWWTYAGMSFTAENVHNYPAGAGNKLPDSFLVEASSDGNTWVTVDDVTGYTSALYYKNEVYSGSGKYIRITARAPQSGETTAKIANIQIFNTYRTGKGPFTVSPEGHAVFIGGNVGIGTTLPGAKVDIYTQGANTLRLSTDSHSNNQSLEFYSVAGAYHKIVSNVGSGNLQIRAGDGGSGHEIQFYTDGTYRGEVTSAGALSMASGGTFVQPVTVGTPTAAAHATTKSYVDSATTGQTGWTDGGANVYLTTIGDSVGIGTATPGIKLDVSGQLGVFLASSPTRKLMLDYTSGVARLNLNTTSDSLGIAVAGSDKIFINGGTGNVGIGTGSPNSRLHVNGTFEADNGYKIVKLQRGDGATNNIRWYLLAALPTDNYRTLNFKIISSNAFTSSPYGIDTIHFQINTWLTGTPVISHWLERNSSSISGPARIIVTNEGDGNIRIYNTTNRYGDATLITETYTGIGGNLYSLNPVEFAQGSSVPAAIAGSVIYDTNSNAPDHIISVGSVGIGTVSPSYTLDVAGTGRFTQPVLVGTPTNVGHAATKSYVDSAAGGGVGAGSLGQTLRHNGTAWVADSNIYNNGTNVGIGTTNPSKKLHIESGSANIGLYSKAASGWSPSDIFLWRTDIGGTYLSGVQTIAQIMGKALNTSNAESNPATIGFYQEASSATGVSGSLRFYTSDGTSTSNSERMRIMNTGNVGIGTTSPSSAAGVNRFLHISGAQHAGIVFEDQDVPTQKWEIWNDGGNLRFWAQSGSLYSLSLNSGGNVGIGSTSASYKLDVTGTAQFTQPVIVGTPTATNHATTKSYVDSAVTSGVTGGITGTLNYIPKFTGANSIGNSVIYETGGSIGIGTTSPGYKLTVNGQIGTPDMNNPYLVLDSSSSGGNNAEQSAQISLGESGRGNAALHLAYTGDGYSYIGMGALDANNLPTYYTMRMYYQNNNIALPGRVAVGSTNISPSYQLDVTGTSQFTQPVIVGTPTATNHATTKSYVDSMFTGSGQWTTSGSNIYSTLAGNVGIGTTNPTNKLQVRDGTDANVRFFAGSAFGAGYSGIGIQSVNDAADTVGMLVFGGVPTIFAQGNVGIGTSNPGAKLDVVGSVSAQMYYDRDNTNYYIDPAKNLMPYAMILNGAIGIKNTSPAYDVDVTGTLRATGNWSLGGAAQTNLNMNNLQISGVSKLDVGTIDPLYEIEGGKYATYASSIAGGVKEEFVGRGKLTASISKSQLSIFNQCNNDSIENSMKIANCKLQNFEYVIDFSEIEKGSDLWVWRKTVDFSRENIEVLATAYGVPIPISYEIEGNKIIFRSEILNTKYKILNTGLEFSYRLVGKRFDWKSWPTFAPDQTKAPNLIVK